MKGAMLLMAILFLAAGVIFTGSGAAQVTVRVGDLGIADDAPFYIGLEKGYFREKGIQLKLERFASAAAMMAPMGAGQLDVAGGGINPGLFNSLARGFPIKIVAAKGREEPGHSGDTLNIRSDLKERVNRPADLKGMKVAINARGSALEYMLGKILESDGLTMKDVNIVYMPWPDMRAAFANKAIDAGTLVEPFSTFYHETGLAFLWKRAADVIRDPSFQVAVFFYNQDWAEKNPKAARDYMVAHLKAAREFYEASKGGKNRPEVIDILVKHTMVKDKGVYERIQWAYMDPNGTVSKKSLKDQQDWYARQGLIPKKVDVDAVVDETYVKYALEQLGTYMVR